MSEGWLPNGEPDPNYQGQTWATPEEKTRILEKYENENLGVNSFGNSLNGKTRKKVTNYTPPKKKRKK